METEVLLQEVTSHESLPREPVVRTWEAWVLV